MGLVMPLCCVSATSSPCHLVFVRGRCRRTDWLFRIDCFKFPQDGTESVERLEYVEGRSSPSLHCPQKAMDAQAATAASRGSLRFRLETRMDNIDTFTGSLGRRLVEQGARFPTPVKT